MTLAWYDLIGLSGSALVLSGYFLLQSGRLSGTGLPYQWINIVGSACILVSLVGGFNLSVALLQCAWIAISVYGIVRAGIARRRAQTRADARDRARNAPLENK